VPTVYGLHLEMRVTFSMLQFRELLAISARIAAEFQEIEHGVLLTGKLQMEETGTTILNADRITRAYLIQ